MTPPNSLPGYLSSAFETNSQSELATTQITSTMTQNIAEEPSYLESIHAAQAEQNGTAHKHHHTHQHAPAQKQLQICEKGVIEILKNGSDQERSFLTKLLGKDNLPSTCVQDRIKTMDDVFAAFDTTREIFYQHCDDKGWTDDEIAYRELKMVAEVLNEEWEADWNDEDQPKWYPWFDRSGSGFAFLGCDFVCTPSGVGSRLLYRSSELAEYAGKQFIDIYKRYQ